MDKPIEFCVNMSGYIIAGVKGKFPEFRFWHSIEETSGHVASLSLFVADQRLPAFARITIRCEIPSSSFSVRSLALHTCSTDWNERECPRISAIEDEITHILEQEEKQLQFLPRFAFKTAYGGVKKTQRDRGLKIRFQETVQEVDIAN